MVEALIDTCLKSSLQLHDVLHGFRAGRGTGTAVMELNLVQELSSVDNEPVFLVLLYLQKAYDTVYRDRLIKTLEGCGEGPYMCRLLETFCSHQ